MLDFACCLVEVAGARGADVAGQEGAQTWAVQQQQQSLVADQISSLSREWRSADPQVERSGKAQTASPAVVVAAMRSSWFST